MRKKHDAASKRIVFYWHKLWKIKMTPVKQELHVETRTRINCNSLFSRQRCSGGFVHWICPNSERRFEAIAILVRHLQCRYSQEHWLQLERSCQVTSKQNCSYQSTWRRWFRPFVMVCTAVNNWLVYIYYFLWRLKLWLDNFFWKSNTKIFHLKLTFLSTIQTVQNIDKLQNVNRLLATSRESKVADIKFWWH